MEQKQPVVVDIGQARAAAIKPARKDSAFLRKQQTSGELPILLPSAAQLRNEIDEYSRLVEATAAPNSRKETLRKRILAAYNLAPTESVVAFGNMYEIDIPPQAPERKVTRLAELYKFITPKRFFSACSFTIANLEKVVPLEEEQAQFLETANTGGRTLKPSKRFREAA